MAAFAVVAGWSGAACPDRAARRRRCRHRGDRASGGGEQAGGDPLEAAVCGRGSRRVGRTTEAGTAADDRLDADRAGHLGAAAGTARGDALVEQAAGQASGGQRLHGVDDVEEVGSAAVAVGHVQVLHRPRAGSQDPRRRRALPRPAGEGRRALRRREVPGAGVGPHGSDPAAATRDPGEADSRLRPARNHHPVRGAGGREPARSPMPVTRVIATTSS